jgi:phage regulator Rha-like protein
MTSTDIALHVAVGNGVALTMSSREIAELCEKRHDHVMRDIKKMFDDLGEDAPKFGGMYEDAYGRQAPCFDLPRDLTLTLVAGYNVKLRKRIIDRWMELEEGARKPQFVLDPSDPKVMLACFDYLQKQVQEKDAIIAVQGEQVKKLERLEGATGSMCITDAAKTLGVGRNELINFMQARRWIYKRPGNRNWVAFDDKRRALLMEHDEHIYTSSDGQERVATRALVTAKGLVKLAELLNAPLH